MLATTGKIRCTLRLDTRFLGALYSVFSVLFVTGVAWLAADRSKDISRSDAWSASLPILLMLHGGAAMLALILLGALLPLHVLAAWKQSINRVTGTAMLIWNALLIFTAFGLYYIASDTVREWTSDLHIALGLAFPGLLFVHVATGRHCRPPLPQQRLEALSEPCAVSDTVGSEVQMANDG